MQLQEFSKTVSSLTIHLPDHLEVFATDQEGYQYFREHAQINPALHTHWETLLQDPKQLHINMVIQKPETPVLRFYTKLWTVLEAKGITITLISKPIADKIYRSPTPVLWTEHTLLYTLSPTWELTESDHTMTTQLQKILLRSRPLSQVLSCK